MRKITLDIERMRSLPMLHKYLHTALALPEYYGANLDALYDCLTERGELEVTFTRTAGTRGYFPRVYRVFERAAAENAGLTLRKEE